MTIPGFTAEASFKNLHHEAFALARTDGQGGWVKAAAAGLPGKVSICDLLPYFPELEPLCCMSIRDKGVSCMCQCKYSTGNYAPPNNVCSGPPDLLCIKACHCACYGGCGPMGIM